MSKEPTKLDTEDIRAIESVISKGDRVEIIPAKDGYKIVKVSRETIKAKENK